MSHHLYSLSSFRTIRWRHKTSGSSCGCSTLLIEDNLLLIQSLWWSFRLILLTRRCFCSFFPVFGCSQNDIRRYWKHTRNSKNVLDVVSDMSSLTQPVTEPIDIQRNPFLSSFIGHWVETTDYFIGSEIWSSCSRTHSDLEEVSITTSLLHESNLSSSDWRKNRDNSSPVANHVLVGIVSCSKDNVLVSEIQGKQSQQTCVGEVCCSRRQSLPLLSHSISWVLFFDVPSQELFFNEKILYPKEVDILNAKCCNCIYVKRMSIVQSRPRKMGSLKAFIGKEHLHSILIYW